MTDAAFAPAADKGIAAVIGPEEGVSFWQPLPSTGYATVKISPFNAPFNHISAGIQVLEPGTHVRNHAHQRNEEMLFVYEGTGKCLVDGRECALEPGALIVVGRNVEHKIFNDGPGQMKMFWVFTPPGLENWFAAIGRPRRPGEPPPAPFTRPQDIADVQKQVHFVPVERLEHG